MPEQSTFTISIKPVIETVVAVIYFDGRQEDAFAKIIREGEEGLVDKRYVSMPDSEGGGVAKRGFLFREVGLESYLNGLDLEGKDVAAPIQRKKVRLERGQITVEIFRVHAFGKIKRGKKYPQFDAHDDDEATQETPSCESVTAADVDYTISFTKLKIVGSKTPKTQSVIYIDSPDDPYAVFTFLYRGERQLQKMGILPAKRRSAQLDFSSLKPLKPVETVGYAGYRERNSASQHSAEKSSKKMNNDGVDSDADDEEDVGKKVEADRELKKEVEVSLSPEEARKQGELVEGVRKIKLKRQHSADVLFPAIGSSKHASDLNTDALVGSPFKKPRAGVQCLDDAVKHGLGGGPPCLAI